jgi:hypothetical protein
MGTPGKTHFENKMCRELESSEWSLPGDRGESLQTGKQARTDEQSIQGETYSSGGGTGCSIFKVQLFLVLALFSSLTAIPTKIGNIVLWRVKTNQVEEL